MKALAVVGARLNSSRLAGKHLLPLCGKPLIEQLLQRLKKCEYLNEIVLATTADDFNQPLLDWSKGKVECLAFDGDVNDLVARINAAVDRYNADIVVYICGDCPLVDPSFIDKGILAITNDSDADEISVHPHINTLHEGIHIYSRKGWNKLFAMSKTRMEREHVGYANKRNPCLEIKFIDDCFDYSLTKQRISVDTPADYEFMKCVYEKWYKSNSEMTIVPLPWVQAQLIKDNGLSKINAHVIQKKADISYKKVEFFCHVSSKIGLGHLKRCAVISEALQENYALGTHIHIIGEEKQIPWLTTKHSWYKDLQSLLTVMNKNNSECWLLDFHPDFIDTDLLQESCRKKKLENKLAIIAIDKMSDLLPVVDKLFIPSFYSELESDKVSYGWDNYLLEKIPVVEKSKRVLVLTGGSDALGYGKKIPEVLEKNIPLDWNIDWVVGPYAPMPVLPNESKRWDVIINPDNMLAIIAQSEVVISCYGVSLIEALATGASTLLLPVEKLCSERELKFLISYECCLAALTLEALPGKLHTLFENTELISTLNENASALFANGSGIKKLGAMIQETINQ